MIAVLDYGVGNLNAFVTIYRRLNIHVEIASKPEQLAAASHIILPGVGSFDDSMAKLNTSGLRHALDLAVADNKPLLGVCVGMQMLANSSAEGNVAGLGYIPGKVHSLKGHAEESLPIPHMGWNDIKPKYDHQIWSQIDLIEGFYFLHSYYYAPDLMDDVFAVSDYSKEFACAVKRENVYGFQFHPEKSLLNGVKLLANFSRLAAC